MHRARVRARGVSRVCGVEGGGQQVVDAVLGGCSLRSTTTHHHQHHGNKSQHAHAAAEEQRGESGEARGTAAGRAARLRGGGVDHVLHLGLSRLVIDGGLCDLLRLQRHA